MRKFEIANGEYFENSVKGDLAQTNDDLGLDDLNLAFQIWLAIVQLCWTWLIVRRRATA